MAYLKGAPEILYKYRDYTNDFNKKTLFEFELFLSTTTIFNDPYEGLIPFSYNPKSLTQEKIYSKLQKCLFERPDGWLFRDD